jgi:PKD repeat protein
LYVPGNLKAEHWNNETYNMKTNLQYISRNYRLCFVTMMVALFSISAVNGTSYYARVNGDWNINTTWSYSPGGIAVPAGVWPGAGDDVYISEGSIARSVTVPASYTAQCVNIYMGTASSGVAATLQFSTSSSALQVSGNVIVYGPNAAANRIINVNAGTMTILGNLELGVGQTGTNADRICRVVITYGTVTVTGNLAYHNVAGSSPAQTLINMSGGACLFNLGGYFTVGNNLGTLTPGTLSTFNFNGTAVTQTIPSGISNVVFNHVRCNNTSAGGAVMAGNFTASNITGDLSVQTGTLSNGGFAITLAPGMDFSVANGATFRLLGSSAMTAVSGGGTKTFGPTSLVDYAGTVQTAGSEVYGHLAFNGAGTKTLATPISLLGNWTNNSTVDAITSSGTVIFSGSASPQNITGSSITSFFDLFISNPNGVVLGKEEEVLNTLTFTSGILTTGVNIMEVTNAATGAIAGTSASSYINGNLQRAIAAGASTYTFPTGTSSAYAPVSIDFDATTEAGSLLCYTTDGDHVNIATSIIYPDRTVNRTWTLTRISGLSTVSYNATFNWVSADQDAAFDYTKAFAGKYNGSSWTYPTMGTITATSARVTGETSFSDFQVGNACETVPTAILSGDTAICQTGGTASLRVDLTGTPPWHYTWSDGVNTGTVTNVMTSPSFFDVTTGQNTTYSITLVGDATGCNAFGSGSAYVSMGPIASLPHILACAGSIIEMPIKVRNFDNVGALSLTVNYNKSVMTYDSYTDTHGFIDYVYCDETGAPGNVRISGIAETSFTPPSDSILLILRFNYNSGSTPVTFDDAIDDTKCEFATGAPDFVTYCDNPASYYYIAGSVTDATLAADFTADDLFPPVSTDVQLTDLSTGGATSWLWSFDRPGDVVYVSSSFTSQNPKVQFTDGGPYTITLTVSNAGCTATVVKAAYIHAGTPGVWDGPTSSDWYTATNWDDHVVPTTSMDVLIPTRPITTNYYPHVLGDLTIGTHCNSITLTGSAELHVDGLFTVSPGKTLDIKDNAAVYAGN